MPDETTILKFRRLLERHALTAQLMNTINDVLAERGRLLKGGTMVDATITHAAPKEYTEVEGAVADERCTTTPA